LARACKNQRIDPNSQIHKPTPPTPLFPLENLNEPLERYVRRITRPIFLKSAQEMPNNHVLVGGVQPEFSYSVYNPHNARFYFRYDKSTLNQGGGGLVYKGKNNEIIFRDFHNCRIVIKKRQLEVTNKINSSRKFVISGTSEEIDLKIKEAVATLEKEAIAVLKLFVAQYAGKTDFVCIKVWIPDNKITHDKIIDSIPKEMTFRNDVVKKVYNDLPSSIEVSTPAQASQTFRNLALHDYAPEITKAIDSLKEDLKKEINPLAWLKANCATVDDIIKNKDRVMYLSDDQKKELSLWTFENLGQIGICHLINKKDIESQ
jgi:hypothetical protein